MQEWARAHQTQIVWFVVGLIAGGLIFGAIPGC